jgi:hypothetical protein
MKYKLTYYKANGDKQQKLVDSAPSLEQLQGAVGGMIEQVPEAYYRESNKDWFELMHPDEVDAVWCHEEALLVSDPQPNLRFKPAPWGDRLYGDVLVVEKVEA